jgi:hypothetical protein
MNRLRIVLSFALLAMLLAVAAAPVLRASPPADKLAGHWEANMTGEAKVFIFVFEFKTNGDALTGTVEIAGQDRSFDIKDGKIKGNSVSFTGLGVWTGTLNGDELNLTRTLDGGKKQEMKAHRKSGN